MMWRIDGPLDEGRWIRVGLFLVASWTSHLIFRRTSSIMHAWARSLMNVMMTYACMHATERLRRDKWSEELTVLVWSSMCWIHTCSWKPRGDARGALMQRHQWSLVHATFIYFHLLWLCLHTKFFVKCLCSTFRCYLAISVQSWTN
jgi:hypothetical protein